MQSKKAKKYIAKNCSEPVSLTHVKETMQLLSGKWKIQIISFLLTNGKTRFMDLLRGVCGISPKVLSGELDELLQHELVSRIVTNPKLISVEYELTVHGKTLENVILSIEKWGIEHLKHLYQCSR